jgi:hypothetical protein
MTSEKRGISMRDRTKLIVGLVFIALGGLGAGSSRASIYDESDIADLSNNKLFPTPFTLTPGSNSIIGTVNGTTDLQDWIAITVPPGQEMTSFVNAVYNNPNDLQGFTGFQFGSSFPGNAFSAGSYAGYAHFGTGAQNGTGPNAPNGGAVTTTVGVDLFSPLYFPNNLPGGTAAGSTGFTPPLGPGTYTFLIQQQGTLTGYEFDMNVSPLPEPATFGMAVLGGLSLLAIARRRRAPCVL